MDIIISGRHVSVTDAIREHAEEKLGPVVESYPKITSARLVLDVQKNRQEAEVIIHGKNLEVEARAESYDMYESIDKAVDKADKQLKKHFDKLQDHHKKKAGRDFPEFEDEEDNSEL